MALIREIKILGADAQLAAGYLQSYLVGCLISENAYTLQGAEESAAINGELVRVLLGDHRFVVRVFPVNEPAHEINVTKAEKRVGLVKLDLHRIINTCKQAPQHIKRLFRKDKGSGLTCTRIGTCVTNELVCIGSNEDRAVIAELTEYAVHHRAKVIVACGKNRLVDGICENIALNDNGSLRFEPRHPREFIPVLTG